MTNRTRATLVLAAAVVTVSCSKIGSITAPGFSSGSADFSVIAALGTGLTAGFQSGGLVDRHQTRGYASIFAQHVAARPLDLPLVDGNGIPQLLEIKRLFPLPVRIGPIAGPLGTPTNGALPTAFHNLGVPGALLRDMTDTTRYVNNPFFPIVQRSRGSLVRQIAEQLPSPPTFVILEYGTTEVQVPASQGTVAGLLSVAAFEDSLTHALDTLTAHLPQAKVAIMNVPDVTNLPYFTANSNKQLDANGQPVLDAQGRPQFLLGPNLSSGGQPLPLTANDLVLLPARPRIEAGIGYPLGTFSYLSGAPVPGTDAGLSDAEVLNLTELLTIRDRAKEFSFVIDTTARSRKLAVVDLDGLYRTARTTGFLLRGVRYSSDFVTGGVFSLDGLHPNDLGHALVCNQLIEAVNAKYGSNLQPLDPLKFGTLTASRAAPVRN